MARQTPSIFAGEEPKGGRKGEVQTAIQDAGPAEFDGSAHALALSSTVPANADRTPSWEEEFAAHIPGATVASHELSWGGSG